MCTDVAARGLDIKDVPAVFNFDIPFNAEDHVHASAVPVAPGRLGWRLLLWVVATTHGCWQRLKKLIKTKIELAVEFDEDQPDIRKQGRINDGRLHVLTGWVQQR